ncbi:MAG TPA: RNA-binding cell elongation regulator Jag/EloR [Acidimicrobiales bacterium]
MEWVETTGRSIEDAKDKALDQLGVDEQDAEFEIVEEPRPGLFGRTRGEARVRARVRPTSPRPKVERRDKRRKQAGGSTKEAALAEVTVDADAPPVDTASTAEPAKSPALASEPRPARSKKTNGATRAPKEKPVTNDVEAAQREADAAGAFLVGLAEAFGSSGSTRVVVHEDEAEVCLDGEDLGLLIGPRGQTLSAVQELTRLAVTAKLGERQSRFRIDIAGYREKRKAALVRFTEQVAAQVRESGTPKALEPMTSADRKIVHDTASALGVTTTSEGEDPFRRVVIMPLSDA